MLHNGCILKEPVLTIGDISGGTQHLILTTGDISDDTQHLILITGDISGVTQHLILMTGDISGGTNHLILTTGDVSGVFTSILHLFFWENMKGKRAITFRLVPIDYARLTT
ncbi:MAG: hypothetical protein WCQ95_07895 [Bacteroidota bacterium]